MILHLCIPEVTIIKKISDEFKDDQGHVQPYYKLTIATSDDAGTLSCTKDVYDKAQVGKIQTIYIDSYDVIRPYKGNDSTKLKVINIR